MSEKLANNDYGDKLRSVYFPLIDALADDNERVRIGPRYQLLTPPLRDVIFTPLFVLHPGHYAPSAHDAYRFFIVAQEGNQIVGHRITGLVHNANSITASDEGRANIAHGIDLGIGIELIQFHILDTLALIRKRDVYYSFSPPNYFGIDSYLGLVNESSKKFKQLNDKGLIRKPYADTFDEFEEVILSPYMEPSQSNELIKTKPHKLAKSTRIPELRIKKMGNLIDTILPLMKKTIGI